MVKNVSGHWSGWALCKSASGEAMSSCVRETVSALCHCIVKVRLGTLNGLLKQGSVEGQEFLEALRQ